VPARPWLQIPTGDHPGSSAQAIPETFAEAFITAVGLAADRNTRQPDSTASRHDGSDSHRPREMVFAGHKEQMMDSLPLEFIHERREIPEGVLGPVIESNPVLLETGIAHQPLGVFGIGPPTHDQRQVHPASQMQTHALAISITSENQNSLGLMVGECGLRERAQGATGTGAGNDGSTKQQRPSAKTHHTGPTGDVG
tara:strand:+ start:1163 stop:1753 length:591 start_codon:yes stop_codon:yes gene_type:complete